MSTVSLVPVVTNRGAGGKKGRAKAARHQSQDRNRANPFERRRTEQSLGDDRMSRLFTVGPTPAAHVNGLLRQRAVDDSIHIFLPKQTYEKHRESSVGRTRIHSRSNGGSNFSTLPMSVVFLEAQLVDFVAFWHTARNGKPKVGRSLYAQSTTSHWNRIKTQSFLLNYPAVWLVRWLFFESYLDEGCWFRTQ